MTNFLSQHLNVYKAMHLHIYLQISYSVIVPIPRVHGVKHLNVYFFHHGKQIQVDGHSTLEL